MAAVLAESVPARTWAANSAACAEPTEASRSRRASVYSRLAPYLILRFEGFFAFFGRPCLDQRLGRRAALLQAERPARRSHSARQFASSSGSGRGDSRSACMTEVTRYGAFNIA